MDQTLSSVHTLMRFSKDYPDRFSQNEIILMDGDSLMMYLDVGLTKIVPSVRFERADGCGLIPLGHTAQKVCTSGLKWDVGDFEKREGQEMSMYGLVSTSNSIVNDCVRVLTSHPIIWVTSLIDSPNH